MKKIRLVALLLAVVMVFALGGCGSKSAHISLEFDAITSEQDVLLRYNPDRGWRGEAYVNLADVAGNGQGLQPDPTVNVRNFVERYKDYPSQICQVYFYLSAYKDTKTLPDVVFERMQKVFDCADELGIKLTVRFAYQGDMIGTGEASDEIMLAHMKQLKPILEKNVKRIHVLEAGFLGSWGEWHSYKMQHRQRALLKGILEMTPKELYVQVRYPGIKNLLPTSNEDYDRIGFHDDSFFGYRYCSSASTLNPGEKDWNQVIKESAFAPTGGETFWGAEHNEEIDGYDSILQFSAFRQNSFSIYHSFIEKDWGASVAYGQGYAMEQWQQTEINEQWLIDNNITYAPGWFLNQNGEKVERNVFDFIADHFGYKLELRDAEIEGDLSTGGKVDVKVNLVNYGFSAAFNMKSSLVVLDEDNKIVSEVKAGKPETWNSRNPEDYSDSTLLTHNIKGTVELPNKSGKYKLAVRLCNSAGTGARFGNNLQYNDGSTVIYEFEI